MPEHREPPVTTQRTYAPLPSGGWHDVELVLNNNGIEDKAVRLTAYSQGLPYVADPVTVPASSVHFVRLSQLEFGRFNFLQAEAVELDYVGKLLEIGAQITLLRDRAAGAIDIPFSMKTDYRSPTQEAVWPSGRGNAVIVLGNASDTTVTVTVREPGVVGAQVELMPHSSQTLNRSMETVKNAASAGAHWMKLSVRGPVGSVRATGYVEHLGRIRAMIRFSDPSSSRRSSMFASNLKVDHGRSTLIVRNTSDQMVTVRPQLRVVDDGQKGFDDGRKGIEVGVVHLQPDEVRTIPLDVAVMTASRQQDGGRVSVSLKSDGPLGALIGSLSYVPDNGDLALDVPLREPGPSRHATGSYPWRIDGDYSTIVSITNVSDTPAEFRALLTFAGGSLGLPPGTIEAGATRLFDLRDMQGRLPAGALGPGGYAQANGTFPDNYRLGVNPPSCYFWSTQTLSVNGRPVSTIYVDWSYSWVNVSWP